MLTDIICIIDLSRIISKLKVIVDLILVKMKTISLFEDAPLEITLVHNPIFQYGSFKLSNLYKIWA
jgi:hypothetical protein